MDLFYRCLGVARRRHRNYKAIAISVSAKVQENRRLG